MAFDDVQSPALTLDAEEAVMVLAVLDLLPRLGADPTLLGVSGRVADRLRSRLAEALDSQVRADGGLT